MNTYAGRLLTFHNDPFLKIPVFLSGDANRCILTVGSQTDGFFVLTYMQLLAEEAQKAGWATAQLMLSSSFVGRGPITHERDAEDVDALLALLAKEHGITEVTLFGFGTGVQVVLELMENGENTDLVSRVVLQGIVCDPSQTYFTPTAAAARLAAAEALFSAGNGGAEDMGAMRDHYDIPITPARVCKGGSLTLMEAFWGPALAKDSVKIANTLNQVRVPLLLMVALGVGYRISDEERRGFEAVMHAAASTTELSIQFFEDISDERRRLLRAEDAKHVAAIVFFLRGEDDKRTAREVAEEEERKEMERRSRSVLAKSKLRLL